MADQQLALMKRGEATMFVPVAKVPAWEAEGWKEISRPPIEAAPKAVQQVAKSIAAPAVEKPKGKGK